MNTTDTNNQKGNNQKGFSGTLPANPTHTQNQGGYTPPQTPVIQPTPTPGKNILLWVVVIAVALVLVVFIQRSRTLSTTDDTTATTTETTSGNSAEKETTRDEVSGNTATGVSQGITQIIVSRHPDLTTDVEVMAGVTTLRNFTVTLQERSNITPVLMFVKKNVDSTLSYDDILGLVVFKDVTTDTQ